jgi:hypothetical protein
VLISSLASYVVTPHELASSFSFFAQIISLFVAGFAGAIIMVIFAPFMTMLEFEMPQEEASKSILQQFRRPLYITFALTFASWYFSFITVHLHSLTVRQYLVSYGVLIGTAIVVALLWGRSKIVRGTKRIG